MFIKFKKTASKIIRSNGLDYGFAVVLVAFACIVLSGCASVDPFAHDSLARSQDFNTWWGDQ